MSRAAQPAKRFLALSILLAGILASAALLRGQSLQDDPPAAKPPSPDPAFLARGNETLLRARKLIDTFFEQTSNVVCNEDVAQTIVGKNGKAVYREESVFEYQMLSNTRGGSMKLVESREPRKQAFRDPAKTLLITNGFASMLLILHRPSAKTSPTAATSLKFTLSPSRAPILRRPSSCAATAIRFLPQATSGSIAIPAPP